MSSWARSSSCRWDGEKKHSGHKMPALLELEEHIYIYIQKKKKWLIGAGRPAQFSTGHRAGVRLAVRSWSRIIFFTKKSHPTKAEGKHKATAAAGHDLRFSLAPCMQQCAWCTRGCNSGGDGRSSDGDGRRPQHLSAGSRCTSPSIC